ncbi:MAG: FecR family protein [Bacteroidales bacterium]|nr:MAG: FecR family protein [Bacteroidales bacterium]
MREELENMLSRFLNGEHTIEEKGHIKTIKKIDIDKNWQRFRNSVNAKIHKRSFYVNRNIRIFARIAAAIIILILTATIILIIQQKPGHNIQLVCSVQENIEVRLSEGSTILLNKGAVISYPEQLQSRKREINLSGEAWFEITKSKTSPFYVHLENSTIKVLGTTFNIKEDERGNVTVSVINGKVSFYEKNNKDNFIILEAGQQGIFDSNTKEIKQSKYDSENFLFWKTGKLSFKREMLNVVFKEFEKSYNKNIIVLDSLILQNKLTTTFEGQSLDDIMKELNILFDLQYYMQGDTIYVEKMTQ